MVKNDTKETTIKSFLLEMLKYSMPAVIAFIGVYMTQQYGMKQLRETLRFNSESQTKQNQYDLKKNSLQYRLDHLESTFKFVIEQNDAYLDEFTKRFSLLEKKLDDITLEELQLLQFEDFFKEQRIINQKVLLSISMFGFGDIPTWSTYTQSLNKLFSIFHENLGFLLTVKSNNNKPLPTKYYENLDDYKKLKLQMINDYVVFLENLRSVAKELLD